MSRIRSRGIKVGICYQPSAREPKHQKQGAIQSFAGVGIQCSYDPFDPIVAQRVELVGHDLRLNEQAVLDARSDDGAHPIGGIDVR